MYGCHLSYVPVDVPLAHVVVSPGLDHIAHPEVDADQPVGGDAQHLVLTTSLESGLRTNTLVMGAFQLYFTKQYAMIACMFM